MQEDSTKRLYVQNAESWKRNLQKKRFSDRKLKVKVVERGIILPARKLEVGYAGGVCDENFNFVAGYTRRNPIKGAGGGCWIHVNSAYTVDRAELLNWTRM